MAKQWLVDKFLDFVDSWNKKVHASFERRIFEEYKRSFPNGIEEEDERVKVFTRMREFYYARMMTTATMLLAISSLFVSLVALIIAVIALK